MRHWDTWEIFRNFFLLVTCNYLQDVADVHKSGDGDPDEEKVEGAHHVRHACRMMAIRYYLQQQKTKISLPCLSYDGNCI